MRFPIFADELSGRDLGFVSRFQRGDLAQQIADLLPRALLRCLHLALCQALQEAAAGLAYGFCPSVKTPQEVVR